MSAVQERITLAIGGMTCAACARRVEGALRKAPGVRDATVNLATHEATVVVDPGATGADRLAAAVAGAGYRASAEVSADPAADEARALGRRAAVAAIAGTPVVVIGMLHGLVALPAWISAVLSIPVIWAGLPLVRGAIGALRHRTADMNVLVTIGAAAAFGVSLTGPSYWEAGVAVIGFVLVGRWLEARARRHAAAALGRLRRLVPPFANVVVGEHDEPRPVDALVAGDVVLVRPGETIPIDGEVIDGASSVAEAVLTGEAMPVDKLPGDRVSAGTRNEWGRLVVRATRDAGATTLAAIVAAVEAAVGSRAPVARLADRVAGAFVPIVLVIAAATLIATGSWMRAVAVLVVACPCALGLATPTALVAGLGRAAERGVLFRSAVALERLAAIRTVAVDKTGTLTEGQPFVTSGLGDDRVLALVAGAEEGSEHPLAGAFLRAAGARGVAVAKATAFLATPGRGVVATVEGHEVVVGSPRFVRERGIAVDAAPPPGATPVVAAIDGEVAAVYAVGDHPRAGAREAVAALAALGVEVVMLTGDARPVAERVAADLGIGRVIAEALPADKAAALAGLGRVAMVGDGVNDAPALAAADVGVAMGSATDVATSSAAVVLLRDDLGALAAAIALARRTMRIVRENLAWAFAYNAIAIPAAVAGALTPMLASGAMAFSSLGVVLNSLRLKAAR